MELLRFTTAGSVDDGKSTLVGRLLYDSKAIFEDQMELLEETSKQRTMSMDMYTMMWHHRPHQFLKKTYLVASSSRPGQQHIRWEALQRPSVEAVSCAEHVDDAASLK